MTTEKDYYRNIGVVLIVLFVIGAILVTFDSKFGDTSLNWGFTMMIITITYILASIRMVDAQEVGAVFFFGKPLFNVNPGLYIVPLGICELKRETGLVIQMELPANPEYIFLGDEPKIPDGFFAPIRVTFIGHADLPDDLKNAGVIEVADKNDPLNKNRLTAQVVPIVRFIIPRDKYIEFYKTIGNIEEAKKQLLDQTVAIFTQDLSRVTVAVALKNLEIFSKRFEKELDKVVKTWGADFKNANIKAIQFTHNLNNSISGVNMAEFVAKAQKLEGQGEGDKQKAIIDGRAEGLKKMMGDLNVSGEIVLGAETARGITSNPGQKTIIAGSRGFTDLAGIVAGLGEAVKGENK